MDVEPTRELFVDDVPLLDVRAPVEFAHGAFPCATNLPILDDSERERVGTAYRHDGHDQAEALGYELVSGELRAERIGAWVDFVEVNPGARLYCFRGGQRSQIAAHWLAEAGVVVPRITGGYKAMRRLLIDSLGALPDLTVIAGKTGTGKTELLERLEGRLPGRVVDLEGRARHRGSAFGKRLTPQPAQIDFENAVAIDFLKSEGHVFVEDESRMIGRLNLPPPLQEAMKRAPVILLEDELTSRVNRILKEYVLDQRAELDRLLPADEAACEQRRLFIEAVDAIRKRLGGARHREIRGDMERAFDAGSHELHRVWIEKLLVHYYDPMYEYQIGQKQDRIVFRGRADALTEYATSTTEVA